MTYIGLNGDLGYHSAMYIQNRYTKCIVLSSQKMDLELRGFELGSSDFRPKALPLSQLATGSPDYLASGQMVTILSKTILNADLNARILAVTFKKWLGPYCCNYSPTLHFSLEP